MSTDPATPTPTEAPAASATPGSPASISRPTPAATLRPTSEPADPRAPGDWTIGDPVPLPDDLTLVIGTGCWRCGGQYTTYELIDRDGRRLALDLKPDEVHLTGDLTDPAHLYLAVCAGDCDTYSQLPDAESFSTTLYESFDGGGSWSIVEESSTLYSLFGRVVGGEQVARQFLPQPPEWLFYPSLAPAVEFSNRGDLWPLILGGEAFWWIEDELRLVDESGEVRLDLSGLIPDDAWTRVTWSHDAGWFAVWHHRQQAGTALITQDRVEVHDGNVFSEADIRWLDDRYLIASIEYSFQQIGDLDLSGISEPSMPRGSRTPTLVDTHTLTLHPIAEFLESGAPLGRNSIEGVWRR